MKVLVTGASGFIASHVIDYLHERDIQIIALDRRTNFGPGRLHDGDELIVGDIQDAGLVSEAVAYSDGVIHLAGVLGTSETIDNPYPAIQTNILGSLNVFQGVRQHHKRAVYLTVGNFWMENPYAITKTTAERLAWMFNKEHGTEIAIVRALNAYGPMQKASPVRKIVPNFILPALRGKPLTIYGDGEQVMDMIYVRDVASVLTQALLLSHGQYVREPLRNDDAPAYFEAGTGRRTTVNEIAEMVIAEVGQGSVKHVPMRGGEPDHAEVLGDPETLRPLYGGMAPGLRTLEDGLKETVAWYRQIVPSKPSA